MIHTRRAAAEYARGAGYGRVVRIHRRLRSSALLTTLIIVTYLGVFAAALAVFAFVLNDSPWWRLPVVVITVLAWATVAAALWGPDRDAEGRSRLVVTEGGLLVWAPGADTPSVTVPWHRLRVGAHQLTWEEGGQQHTLDLTGVVGKRDLISAVRQSGRAVRWPLGRLATTAVATVATALVAWFAVLPVALNVVLGERPDHISDFAAMCEGDGGFGRAAPYGDAGPHPIAVYKPGSSYPEYDYSPATGSEKAPPADTVQLVGCVREAGRADASPLMSCPYTGGYHRTIYQGRYRIDVYEAGTGRQVSTVDIDGSRNVDCARWLYVDDNDPLERNDNTEPDAAAYATVLSPLVNGS